MIENVPEDEKQKIVEYRKTYYKMKKKMSYYNYEKLLF